MGLKALGAFCAGTIAGVTLVRIYRAYILSETL
jgi:hypothetical protein